MFNKTKEIGKEKAEDRFSRRCDKNEGVAHNGT
jgi:hypothetical protein